MRALPIANVPRHSGLPGLLAQIAAVAGFNAALKVAEAKGGIHAFFPARPAPDHWLSLVVGHAEAVAICAAVAPGRGGIELLVPLGPKSSAVARWRRVDMMIKDKASVPAIARALGMHERTVQYHKAGHMKRVKLAISQADLFDTP